MEIIRARPEDAARLSALAIAAKAYWGYPAEWIEKWRADLTLTPEYIEHNIVYTAVEDDEIIAFYALIQRGMLGILDHLWVQPGRLRTGVGSMLFKHALNQALALGAEQLELEAEPHAVGFYERMGARHLRNTISDFGRVLPIMGLDLRTDVHSLISESEAT